MERKTFDLRILGLFVCLILILLAMLALGGPLPSVSDLLFSASPVLIAAGVILVLLLLAKGMSDVLDDLSDGSKPPDLEDTTVISLARVVQERRESTRASAEDRQKPRKLPRVGFLDDAGFDPDNDP